ncbi:MAG: hypothetical protein Q8S84_08775 [bacterium]|nr:hypothetical protein [bacterium]MDP3381522.1 hypothetical protein [bacterium]
MLTLEYRNKSQEKAKNFMINLKNKLEILNTEIPPPFGTPFEKGRNLKNIEINLVPNPSKRYNQYYYKIILK